MLASNAPQPERLHPDHPRVDGPAMRVRWRRWWRGMRRVQAHSSRNRTTLLAAGVAFYALLSLVPGLVALLSLYGLVFDPQDVERQVLSALEGAPLEVRAFVSSQLTDIAQRDSGTAITSIVVGIVAALWSASGGMSHLLAAIDAARGGVDRRNGLRKRGSALIVTLGAMGFAIAALAALTFLPSLLSSLDIGLGALALRLLSWLLLLFALVVGLSLLYRVGPATSGHRWFHVSPGVVVALCLWLVGSIGFSIYTANFASYNETYGSLGAVVVVMLWLFISAYAIMLGAEVNADRQRRSEARSNSSEYGEVLLDTDHGVERIPGLGDAVDDGSEGPQIRS